MDPTFLATIVGLICNYRQEVACRKAEETESFQHWLDNDRHQTVLHLLRENTELSDNIQQLLEDRTGSLAASLESISRHLALVVSKVDGFRSIQQAIAPRTELSEQAGVILSVFVGNGAVSMTLMNSVAGKMLALRHEDRRTDSFTPSEQRFLITDLETLCELGFIALAGHGNRGEPRFALTRDGVRYAEEHLNPSQYKE